MSVSFHILADRGLVYVRYEGVISSEASGRAFAEYAGDPDFRPHQKQLVDLSAVTGWAPDFAELMALQARKAEALFSPEHETMMVYLAPDTETQNMARWVLRSWDGIASVVTMIIDNEAEALAVLGQPETRVADLLQSA